MDKMNEMNENEEKKKRGKRCRLHHFFLPIVVSFLSSFISAIFDTIFFINSAQNININIKKQY